MAAYISVLKFLQVSVKRVLTHFKSVIALNKSVLFLSTAIHFKGAQWLSGRVLDSRPHRVVVLDQDTFILA